MNLRKIVLIIGMIIWGSNAFLQSINTTKSVVEFKTHAMGVFGVKGTFTGFSGKVVFQPENLKDSKINVCIDATTFKTGNESRDEHVKSSDFLYVEKYPKVCFISKEIKADDNGFVAIGTLQLHGIKKQISIPLQYINNTLVGNIEISRLEYNVGEDIGTFKASENVEITIRCILK